MSMKNPNGGFVAYCKCEKLLGGWVAWQRYRYRKRELEVEQIAKLESLGFLWEDTITHEAESEAEEPSREEASKTRKIVSGGGTKRR